MQNEPGTSVAVDTSGRRDGGAPRLRLLTMPPAVIWFYVGSLILLYVFVAVHTPLGVAAVAPHDDSLYMSLGQFLAEGRWLGPFSQFTLMKGPGYPAFLAISNWLGAPISLTDAVFHCAAVTVFVVVAHQFIRSYLLSGLLFALLLWHPAPFSYWLLRVVRDRIYFDQLLILLAALAWALFCAREDRQRVLFAGVAGAMLGWFWLTREEGVWILPALAVLVAAAAFGRYRQARIRSLAITLLIFVGVFAATQVSFRAVNWWAYGKFVGVDFEEKNFQRALGALDSVRSGGNKPFVSITDASMRRVSAVSPTFASLEPYFDGPGKRWESFGCSMTPSTCGEIAGGWFMWALRDAAERAGHFASATKASAFFGGLADEVEGACRRGELECVPQLIPEMPQWSWRQLANGLRERYAEAFNVLLLLDVPVGLNDSNGTREGLDASLRFLNYPMHAGSTDASPPLSPYTISGWYYRIGADWIALEVKSANGSIAAAEIERRNSPDIATHFHDDAASRQRFWISVECSDQCVLQGQTPDGEKAERTFADLLNAPLAIAVGQGALYVDKITAGFETPYRRTPADVVASRTRLAVLGLYKYVFVPVFILGTVAFAASTVAYRKKAFLNVSYVMALVAWLLVVSRVALLLLITLTAFPALKPLYMAPAYFMLVCAVVLSCAAWLQLTKAQWAATNRAPNTGLGSTECQGLNRRTFAGRRDASEAVRGGAKPKPSERCSSGRTE